MEVHGDHVVRDEQAMEESRENPKTKVRGERMPVERTRSLRNLKVLSTIAKRIREGNTPSS